jgi:uncharacterized membrane protein
VISNTFNQRFWWRSLVIIILILGIIFRFVNLEEKIYWHDEVYTSLRAAGFTSQEVYEQGFQNQLLTPAQLLKFQAIKPDSTVIDTIYSLAIEDPQHPPLYFILARYWMQLFGSSFTAFRSLPALISLLSWVFICLLAREIFGQKLTAPLAVILLAISPFDILFAQIARQYSSLTFLVIASTYFLFKADKNNRSINWIYYTIVSLLGLYTHPFFALTLFGHGLFIVSKLILTTEWRKFSWEKALNYWWRSPLKLYLLSSVINISLFFPWLLVIKSNSQRALNSTSWAASFDSLEVIKYWILSFSSLFTDLYFGNNLATYSYRLLYIAIILTAIYLVITTTKQETWLLISTSIFVPLLLLVVPDILLNTHRSAVTRYLIPCFPGIQLAVAYLVSYYAKNCLKLGQIILVFLLTSSIISNSINAISETSWSKGISYYNGEISRIINTYHYPLLVSDRGSFTNLGNLISLAYCLDGDTRLLLLSYPPQTEKLKSILNTAQTAILVFRPSEELFSELETTGAKLKSIFPKDDSLWELKLKSK